EPRPIRPTPPPPPGADQPPEPSLATAGGRRIRCQHCGSEWFWHRRVVMSSGTATLFGVDAFSPEVAMLDGAPRGHSAPAAPVGRRITAGRRVVTFVQWRHVVSA